MQNSLLSSDFVTRKRCLLFLLLWLPITYFIMPVDNGGFGVQESKTLLSGHVYEWQPTEYQFPVFHLGFPVKDYSSSVPVTTIIIKQ